MASKKVTLLAVLGMLLLNHVCLMLVVIEVDDGCPVCRELFNKIDDRC
jgi:hypothetical protein